MGVDDIPVVDAHQPANVAAKDQAAIGHFDSRRIDRSSRRRVGNQTGCRIAGREVTSHQSTDAVRRRSVISRCDRDDRMRIVDCAFDVGGDESADAVRAEQCAAIHIGIGDRPVVVRREPGGGTTAGDIDVDEADIAEAVR